MARFRYCIALFSLALFSLALTIGCGSETPTDQGPDAAAVSGDPADIQPSPTDVISHFLDEIRRGGNDSRAQNLLTKRAQDVLTQIGQTVQPIGSPDAQFEVTRSEAVPGEDNAVLVHSLWREPQPDGTLTDYQVVWAVEREDGRWRISGLAIEITPNQPPQIVDFENGELMAKLLVSDSSEGDAPSQEAADSSISR